MQMLYWTNQAMQLSNRIESAQYNAALAITGTIRGTSKEKLYQEGRTWI